MDYHALEKMTVVQLREEAKKHDFKGVTGMKKDELIAAIAEKLGLEKPAVKPGTKGKKSGGAPLDRAALKAKIAELRSERDRARSDHDRKMVNTLRRRIHSLKRRMRRVAQ
jgi:hypothetical protein